MDWTNTYSNIEEFHKAYTIALFRDQVYKECGVKLSEEAATELIDKFTAAGVDCNVELAWRVAQCLKHR